VLDSRVVKQLENTLGERNHWACCLWEEIGKMVKITFVFGELVEVNFL